MRAILHTDGIGVVVADATGKLVYFNEAARKIVGLGITPTSPSEWPATYGTFLADTLTPIPVEAQPMVKALAGHRVADVELFIRNQNVPGGVFVSASATPMWDQSGRVIGGVVVFRDVTKLKRNKGAAASPASSGDGNPNGGNTRYGLSPREITVLRLVADGNTDAQVGILLGISCRTAEGHMARILKKMQVASRTMAVRIGVESGLIG